VYIYIVLWQRGLVEREINELLRGLTRDDDERNKSNYDYKIKVFFFLLSTNLPIKLCFHRMKMELMLIMKLNNVQ